MRTDSLFYRLFQDWPDLVLELAGLATPAAGYTLRAEEIKQTGFRLDGVLVPSEDRPDGPLVFVETQFQRDPDFHARWFSELFLYLYRRPPRPAWRAVALFPNRATEGPAEAAYARLLADPWVKRVYLEEALQAPAPTRGVRVLGLMLAPPDEVVATAKALLAEPAHAGEWPDAALADWVETLLVYKLPRLSREEIRKMLDMLNVELKQTRFYQEVFAEGLEEGRQEGRQEGWQEGLQQGEEKGQRQERLRIARSLLDLIADDRLLAEKTGLSEADVRVLRAKGG